VIAIWFSRASHAIAQSKGGLLPLYRSVQLAEGLFALRVERIPNRAGSLADFFFYCDSFFLAQSSLREYTPHLRPNEADEAAPVSQI